MENEIKLLKNNDKKEWSDLEWVNEFYEFLKGNIPEGIHFGKGHVVKLSPKKAFSVIYYLQEHFSLLPDHIEQCSTCGDLYDSRRSGYYAEFNQKFYCDSCFPPFLDEKDQRIMMRRHNKVLKKQH